MCDNDDDTIDKSVLKWCECGESRRFYNQHEYDSPHACHKCGKFQAAYQMSWTDPFPRAIEAAKPIIYEDRRYIEHVKPSKQRKSSERQMMLI